MGNFIRSAAAGAALFSGAMVAGGPVTAEQPEARAEFIAEGGNSSCPPGTLSVLKVEGLPAQGTEAGITYNIGLESGTWTSTNVIAFVIAKGSTGSYTYTEGDMSGSVASSDLPDNPGGQEPDLSNVEFCEPKDNTTTTSTTTTEAPTTTSTTTTEAPTTTEGPTTTGPA